MIPLLSKSPSSGNRALNTMSILWNIFVPQENHFYLQGWTIFLHLPLYIQTELHLHEPSSRGV